MTTKSYLLKLLWLALIGVIFGLGAHNISMAVADYYSYDKITNIERITPDNVTFPAITLCSFVYKREHFIGNESLDTVFMLLNELDASLIQSFIDLDRSHFFKETNLDVDNHLDFFTIPRLQYDCLRFNAVTNKSAELFTASSNQDCFNLILRNSYIEDINASLNEYYNFTLFGSLMVYIGDNRLNSFQKLQPLHLEIDKFHVIGVQKESMETKLPPPFNPCKESPGGQPYHRWNCVEACVARKTQIEFNCTFPSGLFAASGFEHCDSHVLFFHWRRFSGGCEAECPLGDCFSEKFMHDVKSTEFQGGVESITSLKVSFRDLSSLNISQIPKTDVFTFLNNIGGGLGLFMGIALPNVLEFLQFMVEIFVIAFVRCSD